MDESKKKLLISAPVDFLPDLKKRMQEEFECIFSYGFHKEEIEFLLKDNNFDGWLVSPCPKYYVDQNMIDLCPSIKIISTPSTGSNHLNVEYIKNKGLQFYCLKGTSIVENIYASSEFTFNIMISTIRKTPFAFDAVRSGNWRNVEAEYRGRELNGMTLGIIGFGRIGTNLAHYSSAFGMHVMAYDPYVEINKRYVTQTDSLDQLLLNSDVIAVCVHLNEETYKMINANVFNKMKKGVYFINTSRGDVVDENALLENLTNGKVEVAGLDVITDELESIKDQHPIVEYAKKNKNLIITPHMAGLTYDSERKAQEAAFEAINEYFIKGENQ